MKRKPNRIVEVDMGYGPHEYATKAVVIDEHETVDLFDASIKHKNLLVELPNEERIWVNHWNEMEKR